MKILISPYSQKLQNGNLNAKNYPYWSQLISLIKTDGHEIIQVGIQGEEKLCEDFRINLSMQELKQLLDNCDFFISVDNFMHHFAHYYGKKGIVLFGQSDPVIFGYPENINLLHNRALLRQNQFDTWEAVPYKHEAFVSAVEVYTCARTIASEIVNSLVGGLKKTMEQNGYYQIKI